MIRKILVGLGATPFSVSAVNHAVELASTHGASLTGLTVVDEDRLALKGAYSGLGEFGDLPRDRRIALAHEKEDEVVKAFEDRCAEAAISCAVHRERGDSPDVLCRYGRTHDLTVLGLHELFDYDIIEVPENPVSRCFALGVVPILAVPETHRKVEKVLVAYHGSVTAAGALRRFLLMRLWHPVEIRIVCFAQADEDAQQNLEDARALCAAHGFEALSQTRPGTALENLLPFAEEWRADLIVMGDSVRSFLSRSLFGDVVLQAIRNSDRPLFLAH
ncbi:MAG: universal stress protein [Planctomycetota bacterium]|jgi:nucleotide-binding universal stress UspA family protein